MSNSPPAERSVFDVDPPQCGYRMEGGIPVFTPTMAQFSDFAKFITSIERYGMETGIVKVIPPKQWIDSLPQLDQHVKSIKIKNPIMQNISGRGGLFRLQNIEKQKTYDISQWKALCEDGVHQPPTRRGSSRTKKATAKTEPVVTPETPLSQGYDGVKRPNHWHTHAISDKFDYRFDHSEFTPERCEELERAYWRSLTYNQPLYGADMPGSLFDDTVKSWSVPKLDNILNRLNIRIPGVNTAYLYCGMWKSTFAWHLEDMDLFSINYIHFGAPKQWYSISQKDHTRFYQLMRDMWPEEYAHCKEFLRHKTFHASPQLLHSMGIEVNKVVHYQQEFMLTFPFGYHSGFNYGYNVAESVNFADESWIPYGKESKKCLCIDDSVGIDVCQLERHLKGDYTDDEEEITTSLPTPPSEPLAPPKKKSSKRKTEVEPAKLKKQKRESPFPVSEECIICGQTLDLPLVEVEKPQAGIAQAHGFCIQYLPGLRETNKIVTGLQKVPLIMKNSKCYLCNKSGGYCFECSMANCKRSYHPTCGIQAGVLAAPSGKKGYNFFCRFHRPKRLPMDVLEGDALTREWAFAQLPGDIVQCQFEKTDIFVGKVLENDRNEETLLVCPLPGGEPIEIAWKWLRNPGSEHIKAFLYNISTNTVVNAAKVGRGIMIRGEKIIFSGVKDPNIAVDIERGQKDGDLYWITEKLEKLVDSGLEYATLRYYFYQAIGSTDTLDNYLIV